MQIFFYSWSGKTRTCAEISKKILKGELIEITEVKARKRGIWGFIKSGYEASKNWVSEINPLPETQGDTVVLAFPVWASKLPPAVHGALNIMGFNNKNVIVITTMGGAAKDLPCYEIVRNVMKCKGALGVTFIPVVTGGTSEEQWEALLKRELLKVAPISN